MWCMGWARKEGDTRTDVLWIRRWQKQKVHDGTRTRNLPLRRRMPYPLGHADTMWGRHHTHKQIRAHANTTHIHPNNTTNLHHLHTHNNPRLCSFSSHPPYRHFDYHCHRDFINQIPRRHSLASPRIVRVLAMGCWHFVGASDLQSPAMLYVWDLPSSQ